MQFRPPIFWFGLDHSFPPDRDARHSWWDTIPPKSFEQERFAPLSLLHRLPGARKQSQASPWSPGESLWFLTGVGAGRTWDGGESWNAWMFKSAWCGRVWFVSFTCGVWKRVRTTETLQHLVNRSHFLNCIPLFRHEACFISATLQKSVIFLKLTPIGPSEQFCTSGFLVLDSVFVLSTVDILFGDFSSPCQLVLLSSHNLIWWADSSSSSRDYFYFSRLWFFSPSPFKVW